MTSAFYIDNIIAHDANVGGNIDTGLDTGVVISDSGTLQSTPITNGQIMLGTSDGKVVSVTPTTGGDISIVADGDTDTFEISTNATSVDIEPIPSATIPGTGAAVSDYAISASDGAIGTFNPEASTSYLLTVDAVNDNGTFSGKWFVTVDAADAITTKKYAYSMTYINGSLQNPAINITLTDSGGSINIADTVGAGCMVNVRIVRRSI